MEIENGLKQLQAKEHQGLPAEAREWRGSSLTLSEGTMPAADILTLGL